MPHWLGNTMNKLVKDGSELSCGNLCGKRLLLVMGVMNLGLATTITGCGGGAAAAPPAGAAPAPSAIASVAPPVAPPTASTAPATPVAPSAEATKPAPPADDKAKATTATPTEASSGSQPSQSPADSLTAARVAFLIDYANSEAKVKAQANCEKDPKKDDPAAKAACMQKARSQFLADVLVFQKDKKGHITLTIYKRNDSELKEVYIAPVSFANETPNSLHIKFTGGGSGQRPLFKNSNSPTISMPNDYTIELEDSEYGKLRYDAKIGLVDK